jgi:hypothetical protein
MQDSGRWNRSNDDIEQGPVIIYPRADLDHIGGGHQYSINDSCSNVSISAVRRHYAGCLGCRYRWREAEPAKKDIGTSPRSKSAGP